MRFHRFQAETTIGNRVQAGERSRFSNLEIKQVGPSWSSFLFHAGIASWEQLQSGIGVTCLGQLQAGAKNLFQAGTAIWEQFHSAVNPLAELYKTTATLNHVLQKRFTYRHKYTL